MDRPVVLIAVGGSGGHVFPAQQLVADLTKKANVCMAGHRLLENPFLDKKIPCYNVTASSFSIKNIGLFLIKTWVGFCQAVLLFWRVSPQVVVGFGSFHTVPILLAAVLFRKKLFLFEANTKLGKVNRLFAKFAEKVAFQFPPQIKLPNQALVPLLPWNQQIRPMPTKQEALRYFGLEEGIFTILVFGGSQGAKFLNEIVPKALQFLTIPAQVIHITGKGKAEYTGIVSCVKEFETRMDFAYEAADLVIARSGAGTIAELLSNQKPAILIPFPFATEQHQLANAEFLASKAKNVSIIQEKEASAQLLSQEILRLRLVESPIQPMEERMSFSELVLENTGVHLIGIGGIGMSALARILLQKGVKVSGSDVSVSHLTSFLSKEGAKIFIGHDANHVQGSAVVYNSDIKADNPELVQAKRIQKRILHRSDLLHECMQGKKPLLVTGTHGKTTTTSLLIEVLLKAQFDPSFVVGGISCARNSNAGYGAGEYFIAEADESDGSFLKTHAFGAIVTNCEVEHLNFWKTEKRLQESFRLFCKNVQKKRHFFWCIDDPYLAKLKPKGFSYGFDSKADLRITGYAQTGFFDFCFQDKKYCGIQIALLGRHNALNAAAVFGLCLTLGIQEAKIREALCTFQGVKRRMEWKGSALGIDFFDDYGHHPTEIQVTIRALKEKMQHRRLVVLFQPHRFSRTRDLWPQFTLSFKEADLVWMTDIYAASEPPIQGIDGQKLAKESSARFVRRQELEKEAALHLQPGDVVLTLGAGDITHAGPAILQSLRI